MGHSATDKELVLQYSCRPNWGPHFVDHALVDTPNPGQARK